MPGASIFGWSQTTCERRGCAATNTVQIDEMLVKAGRWGRPTAGELRVLNTSPTMSTQVKAAVWSSQGVGPQTFLRSKHVENTTS